MTFTYALPPVSDRDLVRFELGDTAAPALFEDEEIDVKLGQRAGNVLATAADLCDVLATRFASAYRFKWKDGEFDRSKMSAAYAERAKDLRARVAGGLGTIGVTRVDGYSDDLNARDGANQARTGRVRAGYTDPDRPF